MKIDITEEPFKIAKNKKHLFVSSSFIVRVYTKGEVVASFHGGPVLALSPCGEYLITNGGVYMATAPFKCIKWLHGPMTAASFSNSFKSFVVLVDGCAMGYVCADTASDHPNFVNIFDHNIGCGLLDIVYHRETDSWITADAKGRISRYSNLADWPYHQFFPLKQRTAERKIVSSAPCLYVTKHSVFYGSRLEVEQMMVEDFDAVVPLDKLDYETLDDLENHRSVCTDENGGKYRLSLCGMCIEGPSVEQNRKEAEPQKEPTQTISKTGRVYGVTTRSRAKAEAKLTATKV